MKPTVVILLSDKRSGSTFLERELCSSTGIEHVAYTPHSYNETHYWVMAACLLGGPDRQFSNCRRPRVYGSHAQIRRMLEKIIQGNVPDFTSPVSDRDLVFQGWEAICSQFARPVFFEKSPQHPHHWAALELMLEWTAQTDFNVKFIGLVRHPLAVLYSAKQLFHSPPSDRQYPWLEANHHILLMQHFVGSDRFMIVRYEDVVTNALEAFEKIIAFIGLEPDPSLGQSARQGSLEGWKKDESFGVVLDPSVIRLANYFGYTAFECHSPQGGASTSKDTGMLDWLKTLIKRAQARAYYVYNRTFR